MADINFPTSPSIGQQYTSSYGVTYEWDGASWQAIGDTASDATITISADDGLANGGSFTLNQTSNSTIYLNVQPGNNQLVANASGLFIIQSNIDHDSLANFVTDEHIAHSGVTLTAGAGLTGGGTIAASRTFDVGAGNGITVGADTVSVTGANGISVTTAGVNVLAGNSQLVSNATGVWVIQSNIDHDSLANFVTDEHIAHSGVTLTAGAGLTGGGTIAASRTFDVGAGNGIIVNADSIEVDGANGISVTAAGVNVLAGNNQLFANASGLFANQSNIDHDLLANFVADEHVAHSGVTLTAGNGLTGGGTIAASRSFAVVAGNSQLVSNATGVWVIQSNIDHDSLANFVTDEHIAHSGVNISAGSGLTGGGDLTATRTLNVGAANGITVAADTVGVTAANGISVTSAGVNVRAGNTQLVSNTTGVWVIQSNINHNSLSNYVADQHVAHSGVTLTAGAGLTGGGTIAASRTFNVGAANGITVAADSVRVTGANGISVTSAGVNVLTGNSQLVSNTTGVWVIQSNIDHDSLANFASDEHVAHSGVTLTAGAGLTGGGTIAASRTFDVGAGNGITVGADSISADGANGITVTADGINVLAGENITVNSSGVHATGGAAVTNSNTAPSSPADGDMWWHTEEGTLKIFYNDGNTTQWVDAVSGVAGPQGPQGPQGVTGAQGVTGPFGGIRYTFSTTTADSDPGAGTVRFNNASIASVTQLFIDNVDSGSVDVTSWIDSFDASNNATKGSLTIHSANTSDTTMAVFEVNGTVIDGTGYRKVPVSYLSGTLPSNAEDITISFAKYGNDGTTGVTTGKAIAMAMVFG